MNTPFVYTNNPMRAQFANMWRITAEIAAATVAKLRAEHEYLIEHDPEGGTK